MGKQPIRTCIGCRGKFLKKMLSRFVSQAGRILQSDPEKKLPGRGVYVCPTEACIQKAFFHKRSQYRLASDVSLDEIL